MVRECAVENAKAVYGVAFAKQKAPKRLAGSPVPLDHLALGVRTDQLATAVTAAAGHGGEANDRCLMRCERTELAPLPHMPNLDGGVCTRRRRQCRRLAGSVEL